MSRPIPLSEQLRLLRREITDSRTGLEHDVAKWTGLTDWKTWRTRLLKWWNGLTTPTRRFMLVGGALVGLWLLGRSLFRRSDPELTEAAGSTPTRPVVIVQGAKTGGGPLTWVVRQALYTGLLLLARRLLRELLAEPAPEDPRDQRN